MKFITDVSIELSKATSAAYIRIKGRDANEEEHDFQFSLEPIELAYLANSLGGLAVSFPEVAQAVSEISRKRRELEQGPVNEVRGGDSEAGQDSGESGVQRVPEEDRGFSPPVEGPSEEVRPSNSCGDECDPKCEGES